MKLDTLREGSEISEVIMQLFPFLIFQVTDFSGDYLRNYMRELNET